MLWGLQPPPPWRRPPGWAVRRGLRPVGNKGESAPVSPFLVFVSPTSSCCPQSQCPVNPLSPCPLDPNSLCCLGPCVPTMSPRSPHSLDLCVSWMSIPHVPCIHPCIPHVQITSIQARPCPHDPWSPCPPCLLLDTGHRVGNKSQRMGLGVCVCYDPV